MGKRTRGGPDAAIPSAAPVALGDLGPESVAVVARARGECGCGQPPAARIRCSVAPGGELVRADDRFLARLLAHVSRRDAEGCLLPALRQPARHATREQPGGSEASRPALARWRFRRP